MTLFLILLFVSVVILSVIVVLSVLTKPSPYRLIITQAPEKFEPIQTYVAIKPTYDTLYVPLREDDYLLDEIATADVLLSDGPTTSELYDSPDTDTFEADGGNYGGGGASGDWE